MSVFQKDDDDNKVTNKPEIQKTKTLHLCFLDLGFTGNLGKWVDSLSRQVGIQIGKLGRRVGDVLKRPGTLPTPTQPTPKRRTEKMKKVWVGGQEMSFWHSGQLIKQFTFGSLKCILGRP